MKFLHTSDWHLGRSLYGRKRYAEFAAFLDWLSETIETEKIDALLIAGDIFDTSTPSNRAQELYYRFLCKITNSPCCRHVVIIGGNHDSPSFLNAPKEILRFLNVHVVGAMAENPENEVILLTNKEGQPEAIVCAIPYLRDRDIRTVEAGESLEDKNEKLVTGLQKHYREVCTLAELQREKWETERPDSHLPLVAMGHLFTAGGKTADGDGVRELYVGSLAHIAAETFPGSIDYLALGHLHIPQPVGKTEHIRYSGSPIPMGYGEAGQQKKVFAIEFNKHTPEIRELPIPCFQPLERIAGDLDEIQTRVNHLKNEESSAWLEIEYTGTALVTGLRETLEDMLADSQMEIRRIKNKRLIDRALHAIREEEVLEDLDVGDVFGRCLDNFDIPPEERPELTRSYNEIVKALHEEDSNAE